MTTAANDETFTPNTVLGLEMSQKEAEKNNIPNFEWFCDMLKKSDQDPENLGYIHEMMAKEDYILWYNWMIKYNPSALP